MKPANRREKVAFSLVAQYVDYGHLMQQFFASLRWQYFSGRTVVPRVRPMCEPEFIDDINIVTGWIRYLQSKRYEKCHCLMYAHARRPIHPQFDGNQGDAQLKRRRRQKNIS